MSDRPILTRRAFAGAALALGFTATLALTHGRIRAQERQPLNNPLTEDEEVLQA